MQTSEQIANEFVELVQRFARLRPKLVFPNESVASMKQQLHSMKEQLHSMKQQLHSLRDSGVDHEDRMFLFRILGILTHSETPPTMGELSAELGIPLSSATRMADNLVRVNFVERCTDAHDRRVVRLCLTENGRQFIQMGVNYLRQQILQILNHLSPEEQTQLLRLMNKVIDSMQAERE